MNYAQIRKFDVTNGPGVRTTLFVSGCTHNCPGCFNKEQQSFTYGNLWTDEIEKDFIDAANNSQVVGISILGGEPMQQNTQAMFKLLNNLKLRTGKPIWLWTGDKFEDLISSTNKRELLEFVDVLIDGKFEEVNKNLSIKYRGSSNQRVIDVQKSLKQNKVILYM